MTKFKISLNLFNVKISPSVYHTQSWQIALNNFLGLQYLEKDTQCEINHFSSITQNDDLDHGHVQIPNLYP